MKNKYFSDWTKLEKTLLFGSIILVSLVGIIFKSDLLTTICSIVGIITALLLAKGKNLGQIFGLLIVILVSAFMVDLVFYIKGTNWSCEYIKLSEHKIPGCFTVNDTYWGVGGHFTEYKMVTKQNEKDMEIKVIEIEPALEDKMCVICYLPISKFVTFVKAPRTNNSGKTVYYNIYQDSSRAYETKLMKYITVLCVLLFIYKVKRM